MRNSQSEPGNLHFHKFLGRDCILRQALFLFCFLIGACHMCYISGQLSPSMHFQLAACPNLHGCRQGGVLVTVNCGGDCGIDSGRSDIGRKVMLVVGSNRNSGRESRSQEHGGFQWREWLMVRLLHAGMASSEALVWKMGRQTLSMWTEVISKGLNLTDKAGQEGSQWEKQRWAVATLGSWNLCSVRMSSVPCTHWLIQPTGGLAGGHL